MNNDKRIQLEQKRQQLQVKIKAEAYIDQYIKPMQEIFDCIRQQGVTYQIAGLAYVPAEYHVYVEQIITQTPYDAYGFQPDHLQKFHLAHLINTIFDRFPSINPLRYVPDLPEYANYHGVSSDGARNGLHRVIQELGLMDQQVYVYYLNYGIVLQLSLTELSNHEHEDLFNPWHGDVMIFADHADWLISFTLEEEWLGGNFFKIQT